jgi:hypothetical protein
LQRIVGWLQSYGVPIEFVPFSVYTDDDGDPKLVKMESTSNNLAYHQSSGKWQNHWIFNTNETNAKGVYQKMFDRNAAAIYGYPNGLRNLQDSSEGDIVLAYVNKKGLISILFHFSGIFQQLINSPPPGMFPLNLNHY